MGRVRKNSDDGSDRSAPSSEGPDGPYFFPPLALQRRTFCVEVLKKEGIKSLVDLGCGEGSLLGLLTQPASHLDDFPPIIPPPPIPLSTSPNVPEVSRMSPVKERSASVQTFASESETVKSDETSEIVNEAELYHILRRVPAPALYETQLHLRKIYGLDLLEDRLKLAAQSTAPPSPIAGSGLFGLATRWEPLTVELWLGSLIHFNQNFQDAECIVMSEVIEHLSPKVLDKCIPIVFGAYNPRVIVITTPNHDFNRYFDPTSPQSANHRFLDPTGRTSRVFRDDDHKFEWTEEEFKQWSDQTSQQYDFDVEITGCGSYTNYFGRYSMDSSPHTSSEPKQVQAQSKILPPPPNPDRFFATQCAIFRKRYPNESERQARSFQRSALTFHPPSAFDQPRVFQTHVHPISPYADRPVRSSMILDEVRDVFRNSSRTSLDLRELWFGYRPIAEMSGGRVIFLVNVLVKAKREWSLKINESRRGLDAVVVEWILPVFSTLNSEDKSSDHEYSSSISSDNERSSQRWRNGEVIDEVDPSELVNKISKMRGWDDDDDDDDIQSEAQKNLSRQ
ncbi:hypothetical protein CROQUDRAFT_653891 [Cronartium quercuum f. sp. fusiforme G11]|uniref:Small RNA 2'-O-methyltransferase n=1 Tax=Cronartium quercuum f. sp. fusiforme G11 TaxID=708437 RepID=A0A9P6NTQ8_9BASI|nr:hypothetical protein CROQUDRAFT_653891 [Cronartium quercuum f. sp. fusiforme G11]